MKDLKNVFYIILAWSLFFLVLLSAVLVSAFLVGWGSKALGFYVDDRFNIMISALINLVIFRSATAKAFKDIG